jgi:TolB-like protein/DNA-binding winged helix-turn-helix (wHTH) protein/Tfp pilus assembly protein PilF
MFSSVYRFGEFELDQSGFQLSRNGRMLKLERIPMELLIFLAERGGAVVTRQEIIERLWGKDVFVDTEHGINTAVRKIRQVLKDDPLNPRFVQTVTGKGYRFIAEQIEIQPDVTTPKAGATTSHVGTGASPVLPSEAQQRGARPLRVAAAVVVLLALAALAYSFRSHIFASTIFTSARASQIHSIAVLPLANLSGDQSQDYFADGMTDELITSLAKNRNLRVVSRTSAMQFKGVNRPVKDIARELNVDGILEGSIERTASNVHMTVQLIYAPTDTHVWAESYDRDLNRAYSLPEELSQTVAREVKAATSPAAGQRYINPEAHDAYLHGRYLWFATLSAANTLSYFQKAIQLQPDYAAAWAGLADTYALEGMNDRPPLEVTEKFHAAALKALELDPLLPEAHNAMAAWYLFYAWDPAKADVESRRALELDPNFAEGHHLHSYILEVQLRFAEGEAEAKRSAELDPFIHPWELGWFYTNERKFDDAIKELKLQTVAHPQDSGIAYFLSSAYWLKGMYRQSQEQLEFALESERDLQGKTEAHKAWVSGGEPAVERWSANRFKALARKQYVETEFVAIIVAYTGDKEATLKYLEAAYRDHDPDLIFLQNDPMFDFLHSEPRYQAIVKKMGLTPGW